MTTHPTKLSHVHTAASLAQRRDALLAEGDTIRDLHVHNLIDIFRPGDRLVLNNTRVIPARLFGTRQRGEAVRAVEEPVPVIGQSAYALHRQAVRQHQGGRRVMT